jgi:hypothetical protein
MARWRRLPSAGRVAGAGVATHEEGLTSVNEKANASDALLLALGCGRLPRILGIARRHGKVVFGTMEGEALGRLAAARRPMHPTAWPVYLYESG